MVVNCTIYWAQDMIKISKQYTEYNNVIADYAHAKRTNTGNQIFEIIWKNGLAVELKSINVFF